MKTSSHKIPWAPKGPLPWDPLGSHRSPSMGSLGLPRVPSQGIPGAQALGLPRVPSRMGSLGLPSSQGFPPMRPPPPPPGAIKNSYGVRWGAPKGTKKHLQRNTNKLPKSCHLCLGQSVGKERRDSLAECKYLSRVIAWHFWLYCAIQPLNEDRDVGFIIFEPLTK